jgi:hypothetical protein
MYAKNDLEKALNLLGDVLAIDGKQASLIVCGVCNPIG